jgi:DNA-binding CsgD family transcriptional regulator
MNFESREASAADLGRCLELLSPRFTIDQSQRRALRAMWAEIVESRCGITGVTNELDERSAILTFAIAVFVSDERARAYHRGASPCIARRMLAEWAGGGRPFLTPDEVARANGNGGLNVVVTHYGHRRDPRAFIAMYEAWRLALRGWNFASYTAEYFTDAHLDRRAWGTSLGFRVVEYAPEQIRKAGIPAERAPFAWVATRDDAMRSPGYGTALVFGSFSRPRFAFTLRQQHVLSLALDGGTDASIARAAGLSESAVKKYFRMIYDKVADSGVLSALDNGASDQRGAEVRRHLLNYLREHIEELRPYRPAVTGERARPEIRPSMRPLRDLAVTPAYA